MFSFCSSARDDDKGRSAIHWAVRRNKPKILEILLDLCDGNPDIRDHMGPGRTPMYYATKAKNIVIINILLAAGANPTPLHIAVEMRWTQTALDLLNDFEFLVDSKDKVNQGMTPLHMAVLKKDTRVINKLIRRRARQGFIFGHVFRLDETTNTVTDIFKN